MLDAQLQALGVRRADARERMAPATRPGLAALAGASVHEATGPGRVAFAAAVAGEGDGAVFWILDRRRREALHPVGLARFMDPARLVLVRPLGLAPALQSAEEALRSGAVPLVVVDLDRGPDLTGSRRLQLAARAGGGRGLCLVPEGRLIANAAETRWHCAPVTMRPDGSSVHHWERLKDRRGPLGVWQVVLAPPGARTGGACRPPAPPWSEGPADRVAVPEEPDLRQEGSDAAADGGGWTPIVSAERVSGPVP